MTGVFVFCAVLVLLMGGWVFKSLHGSWLTPGPLLAFFWAVGLALPPLFGTGYVISQAAVWYIVLLVALFCVAGFFAAPRRPTRQQDIEPRRLNARLLRRLVALGTATGLAATAYVQVANGYSLGAILSAQGLLDSAAAFSIERYSGAARTPVAVPLLMSFTYAAALLAPFAATGLRRRWAVACYAGPFVAATMYAVATTARSGMLTVAFFLFAGWIVAALRERGEAPKLRPRAVIALLASFAALAAIFVTIAFLRVGSFDPEAQRALGPNLTNYAIGYMPAFSHWLQESATTGPDSWGAATFAGLAHAGDGQSEALERAPLGGLGIGTTNIFTAWRYLVEDFGIAGAAVAVFVLGWLVTWAWRRVSEQPSTGPLIILLSSYAWILNSTTQTVFLFTNIVLAIVIAGVALNMGPPKPKVAPEPPHVRDARRARENGDRYGSSAGDSMTPRTSALAASVSAPSAPSRRTTTFTSRSRS